MASTKYEKHDCGGNLIPTPIVVRRVNQNLVFTFTVDGLVCDHCSEELLPRNSAYQVEQASSLFAGHIHIDHDIGITFELPNITLSGDPPTSLGYGYVSPPVESAVPA